MPDKTWRPNGWKNPYPQEGVSLPGNAPWMIRFNAFEAGADAYAEALFTLAEESPTGTFTIDSKVGNILTAQPLNHP